MSNAAQMNTYAIVRRSDHRVLYLDDYANEYLAQEWFECERRTHTGVDLAASSSMVVMDPDDVVSPQVGDEVIWDSDGLAILA